MKKMLLNLISSFITGLLVFYLLERKITWQIVLVCLACVAIVACGYGIGYGIRKFRKRHS